MSNDDEHSDTRGSQAGPATAGGPFRTTDTDSARRDVSLARQELSRQWQTEDAHEPHVVVRIDGRTDAVSAHGPYESHAAALAAVRLDVAEWASVSDMPPPFIVPVRLFPPVE